LASPELSAIVLCYKAGESIHAVIEPLVRDLESSGVTYELVLVANYWPDNDDPTPEIVRRFAAERDDVVTVIGEKQGAMGWDMRTGLAAAHGDYLVVIDGDAQNPVEDVVKMYLRMKDTGVDFMKGRRIARFDGLYRRVISEGYNLLFRLIFRTGPLWDINGKPKAITRAAYERMNLKSDDWFIDAELVLAAKRLGLTVEEMPVIFRENEERSSFVKFSAIAEFVVNMLRARMRSRRSWWRRF
jgi:glycosyltransferase involved in cell wall biosynthesis